MATTLQKRISELHKRLLIRPFQDIANMEREEVNEIAWLKKVRSLWL